MTKFIVKGRVKYNGKTYTSGSVVEVEDKDVKEFSRHGWKLVNDKNSKQAQTKTTAKQTKTTTTKKTEQKDTKTEQKDTKTEQKDVK